MNTTKSESINIIINDVVFTIDIDVAIKAGIAKPVETHKIGNYYRNIETGNIYILISYYGSSRVALVYLTGNNAGRHVRPANVLNINKITDSELIYVSCGMKLERIDNPLVN